MDEAGLESDYSNEVSTEGTSNGGSDPLIHILPINSNWNLISISNGTGTTLIPDLIQPPNIIRQIDTTTHPLTESH